MKKLLILLSLFLLPIGLKADESRAMNLEVSATNIVATSTNTTAAPMIYLANGQSPVRIYVSASGSAATTNGALTIKFSTASGTSNATNAFDTASLSNIKVVMSNGLTSATVPVVQSDWFVLSGVKYLRVGQIENTYQGNVSNITINVGYPFAQ